eukprot:398242_1
MNKMNQNPITSQSLDKLLLIAVNRPDRFLTPAVIFGLLKFAIHVLALFHSADIEKRSKKYILIRLIAITLRFISYYKYGQKIMHKIIYNKPLKLSSLQIIGLVLSIIGHTFRAYCDHIMRHEYTFVLVTYGPYAFIRHPRYASILIYTLGDCLFLQNWSMYLTVLILFGLIPRRIDNEEEILMDFFKTYKYGGEKQDDYGAYKKSVPYKLIPGMY